MPTTHHQPIVLPNGFLVFKPVKETLNYGFIFKYQQAQLKLSFELQLTFLEFEGKNHAKYILDRSSIYINNQAPDTILYEMANEMTTAIYPVEFTINQNLECVSINNHQAIISSCQKVEQSMTHYYKGDIPNKIIANFKDNYTSQVNLITQLQNDLPFKILFFPLYKSYNQALNASGNYLLKINDQTIDFTIAQQLEKKYNPNGKLVVNIDSIKANVPQASYNAIFYLHPLKHTIASATGTITYLDNLILETLTFECYTLD